MSVTDLDKLKIEQLKWYIDQKLDYFKSFQSRVIQIFGFNGVFLTIIWTNFASRGTANPLTDLEKSIIGLYILTLVFEIIFSVLVVRPRTGKHTLYEYDNIQKILENMNNYLQEKSEQLKGRANQVTIIYIIFLLQVLLFILIVGQLLL